MSYTSEEKDRIFNFICEEISKGSSLRVSLQKEECPSSSTFYLWLDEDNDKSKQYARACEERSDLIFEEILDIADNGSSDKKIVSDQEVIDYENIQRSKLRVDARKWMLGKMNPKKYGDKIQQDVTVREVKVDFRE